PTDRGGGRRPRYVHAGWVAGQSEGWGTTESYEAYKAPCRRRRHFATCARRGRRRTMVVIGGGIGEDTDVLNCWARVAADPGHALPRSAAARVARAAHGEGRSPR